MSPLDPAPAAPEPIPATAPARALIEGQLVLLTRLAHIGMEIAEACGRQAVTALADAGEGQALSPEPRAFEPARDPGLTFARVARAVRMTIALQSRLAKDLAALDRADDWAAASAKDARRMRLRRLVTGAAEAALTRGQAAAGRATAGGWGDHCIEDEIETLSEEAYERLTDAEDDNWEGRPFAEVVAAICGDLGLTPDWTARLLAATAPPPLRPAAQRPDPEAASLNSGPLPPIGLSPMHQAAPAQGP